MKQRVEDINDRIKDGINDKCSQISETDVIIMHNNHAFKCPNNPKSVVVYNAQLHSNGRINTSILVTCLNMWIAVQRSITVTGVELSINRHCTKVVNDNNHDYECAASGNQLTRSDKLAIGFGVAFGVTLIIIILGVVLVIAIICIIRMRRNR